MIERHWDALAKTELAAAYVEHLRAETFPALAKLPGFTGARILRRDLPDGVEFRIVTSWQNLESILAFSGGDPERAVVPEKVAMMMRRFD